MSRESRDESRERAGGQERPRAKGTSAKRRDDSRLSASPRLLDHASTPPTTPAPLRHQLRTARRRNCSASTARWACAPTAPGWGCGIEFLLDRLVADRDEVDRQGCLELLGPFREVGRWRRHMYRGSGARHRSRTAASTKSRCSRRPGTNCPTKRSNCSCTALGDRNITFAWRHGGGIWKHGGNVERLHPRAAGRVPHGQEPDAPPPARKVHGNGDVLRVPRHAAEPAGAERAHRVERADRGSRIAIQDRRMARQ